MGKTNFTIKKNEDGSVNFEFDDNELFDKEFISGIMKSYIDNAKEVAIVRYNNYKETQLANINANKEMFIESQKTSKEIDDNIRNFSAKNYLF